MKRNTTRGVVLAALLAALAAAGACGPSEPPKPPPESLPELSDERIRETIYEAWVDEVPAEKGAAEPISWRFVRGEPTEVAVVEKQLDGKKATVLMDVTARSAPHTRNPKVLAGRLLLHYELQTEIFLRRWQVVDVDNISMTYRDDPRPADGPAPAGGPDDAPAPPPPPRLERRPTSS